MTSVGFSSYSVILYFAPQPPRNLPAPQESVVNSLNSVMWG